MLFTIPMEDMVLDTVPILLDMVMGMVITMDLDTLGTMESVKLRLSQRLMLSMVMVMDLDTVHTPLVMVLVMADTLVMDMDMGVDMDTMVKQSGIKSAEPWK